MCEGAWHGAEQNSLLWLLVAALALLVPLTSPLCLVKPAFNKARGLGGLSWLVGLKNLQQQSFLLHEVSPSHILKNLLKILLHFTEKTLCF